jgi:hypothetical protein
LEIENGMKNISEFMRKKNPKKDQAGIVGKYE